MSADENSDSSPQRGEVGRGEYWPLHPALISPTPTLPRWGREQEVHGVVVTRF